MSDSISVDQGTPLDDLFEATNRRFDRLRHSASGDAAAAPAVRASANSVPYIRAFWPHVIEAIDSDPERLGLTTTLRRDDGEFELSAAAMRDAYIADNPSAASAADTLRRASVLSALALMSQILSGATARWADDLTALPRRCPLDFLLDTRHYVSLRMLLPRRGQQDDRVGGNAPTLVMGGTATALTMCWNLLDRMPAAYRALTGTTMNSAAAEAVWTDTRELVFRIGSGSLAAFVAFASACSSQSGAMIWDGSGDLGLTRRAGRYAWTANADLSRRYRELLAEVEADQQGSYVGCAALFTRAAALPLAPAWADAVDANREQQVFAELLRWVTAAARRHYFPTLDV
ncbi:MAG: hypothetical protein WD928_14550 [Gammaproteobacteria bacterium]